MHKLGIAVSGGGHRAALFALGVFLYLHDSRRNTDVTTITSVSGGSLTNAFLGLCRPSFEYDGDKEAFERNVSRLASEIAGHRLSWWVSWLTFILIVAVFMGPWNHWTNAGPLRWGSALVTVILWALMIGPRSGGGIWCWWGTWLYVGVATGLGLVALSPFLGLSFSQRSLLAVLVVVAALGRHVVAGYAMERFLKRAATWRGSQPPRSDGILHVICATEMQSGEHTFFCSGNLIVSPILGIAQSGDLPLGAALQASAGFPVAFPPRFMKASRFHFPLEMHFRDQLKDDPFYIHKRFRNMILSDGGVRDNMGMTWFLNQSRIVGSIRTALERSAEYAAMGERLGQEGFLRGFIIRESEWVNNVLERLAAAKAEEFIVVNGAYPSPTQSVPGWLLPVLVAAVILGLGYASLLSPMAAVLLALVFAILVSLAASLTKVVIAMYNAQNARQLLELRQQFLGGSLKGVVISIDDHPDRAALFGTGEIGSPSPLWPDGSCVRGQEALLTRANKVREHYLGPRPSAGERLTADERRKILKRIPEKLSRSMDAGQLKEFCRKFRTTLNPVGEEAAANLLLHGYSVAMKTLPVYGDGYPLLDWQPVLDDFVELICLGRRAKRPKPHPGHPLHVGT